jgi:hypothetical protein
VLVQVGNQQRFQVGREGGSAKCSGSRAGDRDDDLHRCQEAFGRGAQALHDARAPAPLVDQLAKPVAVDPNNGDLGASEHTVHGNQ